MDGSRTSLLPPPALSVLAASIGCTPPAIPCLAPHAAGYHLGGVWYRLGLVFCSQELIHSSVERGHGVSYNGFILEKEPIMKNSNDLKEALDEVSASSAGGAPFLISYGATFLITGILPSSCLARRSPLSPCSRAPPLSRQPSGWSVRWARGACRRITRCARSRA